MIAPALDVLRIQAPGLLVLAPLVAAAIAALSPWRWLARLAAGVGALGVAALAADLALRAWSGLAVVYPIADAPLGVTLRVDGLSAAGLMHLAFAVGFLGLGAGGLSRGAFDPAKEPIAAALLLTGIAGQFAAILATDLLAIALALQVSGLAGAGLTALGVAQDRRAVPAAAHQLIAGGVGVTLAILGTVLIERAVGLSDLQRLPLAIETSGAPAAAGAGLALVALGLALQAALLPMHAWAALAISRGPPIAALALGAAGLGAALYALLRVAAAAAAAPPAFDDAQGLFCVVLGAAGMGLGAYHTLAANDLRRFALYAGLCQVGAALIAAGLGGFDAAAAAFALLHAGAIAAFAALAGAALVSRAGRAGAPLEALDGLARRAPFAALALSIAALSLAGAPMTIGFVAKWLMFGAFLEQGWWPAAIGAALATLACTFAAVRLLERIWLRPPTAVSARPRLRLAAWPPLSAAAAAALIFGIDGRLPIAAARAAAAAFTGEPPP